jgi:hypothetical protein
VFGRADGGPRTGALAGDAGVSGSGMKCSARKPRSCSSPEAATLNQTNSGLFLTFRVRDPRCDVSLLSAYEELRLSCGDSCNLPLGLMPSSRS